MVLVGGKERASNLNITRLECKVKLILLNTAFPSKFEYNQIGM